MTTAMADVWYRVKDGTPARLFLADVDRSTAERIVKSLIEEFGATAWAE